MDGVVIVWAITVLKPDCCLIEIPSRWLDSTRSHLLTSLTGKVETGRHRSSPQRCVQFPAYLRGLLLPIQCLIDCHARLVQLIRSDFLAMVPLR
jgi:hypothetical protein